jgi:hypothetical protein
MCCLTDPSQAARQLRLGAFIPGQLGRQDTINCSAARQVGFRELLGYRVCQDHARLHRIESFGEACSFAVSGTLESRLD